MSVEECARDWCIYINRALYIETWRLEMFYSLVRYLWIFKCVKNRIWIDLRRYNELELLRLQLNKYDTASYFFLFNQNLTYNCLFISVFLTEFAWSEPWIVLNIKTENFRFWSGKSSQIQVETQKSTNNPMSSFGLIEKIWSCLILIKL